MNNTFRRFHKKPILLITTNWVSYNYQLQLLTLQLLGRGVGVVVAAGVGEGFGVVGKTGISSRL